jgi:hypothetical protein
LYLVPIRLDKVAAVREDMALPTEALEVVAAVLVAAKGTTAAAARLVIVEMADLGPLYLVPIRLDKVAAVREDMALPTEALEVVVAVLVYMVKAQMALIQVVILTAATVDLAENAAATLLTVVSVPLTAAEAEHLAAVAVVAKGKQGLVEHLAVKVVAVQ